jgi:tetratricopeptide (TPR) repeat protein
MWKRWTPTLGRSRPSGDLAEAQTQMDRALAVGLRDASFFYHAGAIASQRKDAPAATRYFNDSLAVSPESECGQRGARRAEGDESPMRTERLVCAVLAAAALASAADLGPSNQRQAIPDIAGRSAIPETATTDQRIASLEKLIAQNPKSVAYRNQLAAAYMQKVRETVDFGYLDRAERILNAVLLSDDGNYEALRMREVVELERHRFQAAADLAEAIVGLHPGDPWSYGVLGDASMEMGHYDRAGAAYRQMLVLRPDQSSLNRASWYEFVSGRPQQAIALMQQAIDSGARSPENTAWCLVDLGNIYFKTGDIDQAGRSYAASRPDLPRIPCGACRVGPCARRARRLRRSHRLLLEGAKLGADAGIRRRARTALHPHASAGGSAPAARV